MQQRSRAGRFDVAVKRGGRHDETVRHTMPGLEQFSQRGRFAADEANRRCGLHAREGRVTIIAPIHGQRRADLDGRESYVKTGSGRRLS